MKQDDTSMPWRCQWFGHKWRGVIVLGNPLGSLRRECVRCDYGEWVGEL